MVVPPLPVREGQHPGGSVPAIDALAVLRSRMRKLRQQLDLERFWLPTVLPQSVLDIVSNARSVGLYAPMAGEPDPISIAGNASAKLALPALLSDGRMVFRLWVPGDALEESPWAGRQPDATAELITPDVVLVPLLAFDHALNRLGQGGGHYDRYFAKYPTARRIGIAWDAQRVQSLPVRAWDMPLDSVITEKTCYSKDATDA